MATGFFLLDNAVSHKPKWYTSRQSPLRVIVVHITAGLQGAPSAADTSAEATARYCANTDRKVSWHSGSDTDSHLKLLPASYTAFHCAGANSYSYGHEISKRTTDWTHSDPEWVARTLTHAALAVGPVAKEYGIPLIRQSKAAVENGAKGFVAHSDMDPTRRSDPGKDFPWGRFFDLMAGVPAPKKEGKAMFLYKVPSGHADTGKTFISDGIHTRYVDDTVELAFLEAKYGKTTEAPVQVHSSLKLVRAA